MMGSGCSSQRSGSRCQRRGSSSTLLRRRRCSTNTTRSRSLSSVMLGRFCSGGDDILQEEEQDGGSSENESQATATRGSMKRAARHSIDAEVPNYAIFNSYPTEDNYDAHPTDPTLRCPKSLTDLCIDTVCRSLPYLDHPLPSGLPQDVVHRIVTSLTSHAALNCTTLKALTQCELGALSLANCRGVNDAWLITLSSSSSSVSNDSHSAVGRTKKKVFKSIIDYDTADNNDGTPSSSAHSPPPLREFAVPGGGNMSSSSMMMMMDMEDIDNLHTDERKENMEDDCDFGSRSTSSFISASSRPTSPLLPSSGDDANSSNSNACMKLTFPSSPPPDKPFHHDHDDDDDSNCNNDSFLHNDDISFAESFHVSSGTTTSSLTLLDLRGSQRITDRGLLQLSHTPLLSLEVARLDNCHGITGRGMLAFSRSYRLHTLSMSNCRRLTDEAIVNVSHLGNLMAMNLGGCRCLTDRTLEAVGELHMLQKLDLSQCDLITDEGLSNLVDLYLIDELSLGWCRLISDDGIGILTSQPYRAQNLRTLRLARCSITDEGLCHLETLENLEELDLNGCVNISSEALGNTLGKLLHISSLDVSYCPGILRSSWQGKINSLKSLELCYSGVRDIYLSKLRSLPMLEELNLDSCSVADWGIAHLVDNNVMPNLTTLDLADTLISDEAMSKIAQFENMRQLSLFYCNISNRGLKYLQNMKKLEVLNLDSRDIGDEGLKYLKGLPLKSLDLFSSRVSDLGCAYLAQITTLTTLELCGGGIRDMGCVHLSSLSNLTSLNLSQNERITNCGARSLSTLSNLKALNLSNTGVTADALNYFGGLVKLQSLALYGCRSINDSPGLSALHSELPSLRCLRLNSPTNEDGIIDHGEAEDAEDEYDDNELDVEDDNDDIFDYDDDDEDDDIDDDDDLDLDDEADEEENDGVYDEGEFDGDEEDNDDYIDELNDDDDDDDDELDDELDDDDDDQMSEASYRPLGDNVDSVGSMGSSSSSEDDFQDAFNDIQSLGSN